MERVWKKEGTSGGWEEERPEAGVGAFVAEARDQKGRSRSWCGCAWLERARRGKNILVRSRGSRRGCRLGKRRAGVGKRGAGEAWKGVEVRRREAGLVEHEGCWSEQEARASSSSEASRTSWEARVSLGPKGRRNGMGRPRPEGRKCVELVGGERSAGTGNGGSGRSRSELEEGAGASCVWTWASRLDVKAGERGRGEGAAGLVKEAGGVVKASRGGELVVERLTEVSRAKVTVVCGRGQIWRSGAGAREWWAWRRQGRACVCGRSYGRGKGRSGGERDGGDWRRGRSGEGWGVMAMAW